ncbi:Potassium channel, partial [Coemansia sp. RSA 2611]
IEPWDTITSIMFCMITVTTIGFGNITPSKTYSRILQLVYGPPGIIMFGLMLLNTRNVIVQITRSKFRTAKRDFEAKRRKIEQELAEEHVKRRLAVHPERRNLRSMFTDMMSRVFLSHNQRARAGVPHWLRNRFDEEEVHDMEATHAPFSAPTYATEDQHVPDTAEQHNITFAESSSREQSAPVQETTGIADGHPDDDQAPHAMGRTYTTASRVSQIRDALARPGKLQNVRRRIGLGGRRKKSKEGDGDSATDGYDSDDSDEGETGLDVSQTIQPDGADSPKPGRLDRVLSVASNVRDRVKSRAQGRGKRKTGPRDTAKQLWVALIINVGFWVMSAGIFYATERARWNYFDAMWFCYVAFTTIGYGDYVPITTEGMVAFICLCFVAVGLETFLVVSAVSFFTDLLNRAMKRTRVQKRIAKHRKSLAAYEIRRHIKHPNYNPFSRGDEDNMFAVGFRRFKRWLQHMGDILHGRRSVGDAFTRHRTKDQRERDERLTEGFIRHTTGMGGFAATTWHPPSRTQSFVSTPSVGRRPTSQSVAVFPPHVSTAPHTAVSMPPPDQLRRMQTDSTQSERSASISSAPEDFLWAFF